MKEVAAQVLHIMSLECETVKK